MLKRKIKGAGNYVWVGFELQEMPYIDNGNLITGVEFPFQFLRGDAI
jgi:hypothetical protein